MYLKRVLRKWYLRRNLFQQGPEPRTRFQTFMYQISPSIKLTVKERQKHIYFKRDTLISMDKGYILRKNHQKFGECSFMISIQCRGWSDKNLIWIHWRGSVESNVAAWGPGGGSRPEELGRSPSGGLGGVLWQHKHIFKIKKYHSSG